MLLLLLPNAKGTNFLLLRLAEVNLWEAGVLMEDTEERAFIIRALNVHRLGMEITLRAEIVTHSGKYVRELLLH